MCIKYARSEGAIMSEFKNVHLRKLNSKCYMQNRTSALLQHVLSQGGKGYCGSSCSSSRIVRIRHDTAEVVKQRI